MNITLLQMKNISYFIFVRWLLLILGNICLIIIVACYKYGPKYRYWVINCQTILPLKLHLVWYPWKMSSNSFFICSFICNVTWTLLSKTYHAQSSKTIGKKKANSFIHCTLRQKMIAAVQYLYVISRETSILFLH